MNAYLLRSLHLLSLMLLVVGAPLLSSCNNDDEPNNLVQFRNIALNGANEVPPVTSSGSGTFNGTYDRNTKVLTYTINWSLGDPTVTTLRMHFHGPAEITESKGVRLPVLLNAVGSTNQTYSSKTDALDATQEAELLSGKWYLNIHSDTYPSGELRGQLRPN